MINFKAVIFLVSACCLTQLPAEDAGLGADMKALVAKIQTKLQAGNRTEADLQAELKEFDTLLETHKGASSDEASQVLAMKAMLYLQVLDEPAKGEAILQELKTKYPDSKIASEVDGILAQVKAQSESNKLNKSLKVGSPFPAFEVTDLAGQPLSVTGLKAKVVLVDFWATWCGPCVQELPSVVAAYDKHHADGFEIIGVSLDKDKKALDAFMEKNKMPWPQYFDGLGWQNKLAVQCGIKSIPATFLLDGQGKIIGRDLRGDALEAAVAKALK